MRVTARGTWLCAIGLALCVFAGCGGTGGDGLPASPSPLPILTSPTTASSGAPVNFDASDSTNSQGGTTGLQVRWDWDNDGTFDTDFSSDLTMQHTFTEPGTYTVRMELKQADGTTTIVTRTITVVASSPSHNTAPSPSFTLSPAMCKPGTTVSVDASGCTDAQDSMETLRVRWDWESDGSYDTPFSTTKTATHTYTAARRYNITLEVADSGGLTSARTQTVVVKANDPPAAAFTVSPTTGITGTTFTVDASGSSDDFDTADALQVRWDWQNDGVYDTEYSTQKVTTWQYPAGTMIGRWTIKVEVKDRDGVTKTTTRDVMLTLLANTAPTALFSAVASGTRAVNVTAMCTDMQDMPDDLQVRWDWENDGTYDTNYTTRKTASHTYTTTGPHTIGLQVRDTGGLTATRMQQVTVY